MLPDAAPEMLFIWLVSEDGTLITTLQETGLWRQVALPLPAIAGALASTGATCLFMAHSHPSGNPHPSRADIEATRQIWRLARMLGASLQDHLVIGRQRTFSFRASGLI